MFGERGGSATFARYAFNELISFIAGWAILIDYLIVIAIAAITVPHYLTPISDSFDEGLPVVIVAGLVIALAAALNIAGATGSSRQVLLVFLALADLGLQLVVVIVGAIVVWDPSLLTDHARPVHDAEPEGRDLRGGDRDNRLRRDRGGERSGAGPRVRARRPAAGDLDRRRARPASLHGGRHDRPDGGARGNRAERARDGARRGVHRGAGPGRGAELRPGVALRRVAVGGDAGRGPGAGLGLERRHARPLAPHLRAGDQPADPELAGETRPAPCDSVRRHPDRLGAGVRAGTAGGRQVPRRGLRLRRPAGDHHRPRLDRAAAVHRPGPRAALPRSAQHHGRGGRCRCPPSSEGWSVSLPGSASSSSTARRCT